MFVYLLVRVVCQSEVPPVSLAGFHSPPLSGLVPVGSAGLLRKQVAVGGNLLLFPPACRGPQWLHLRGLLSAGAAAAALIHT